MKHQIKLRGHAKDLRNANFSFFTYFFFTFNFVLGLVVRTKQKQNILRSKKNTQNYAKKKKVLMT